VRLLVRLAILVSCGVASFCSWQYGLMRFFYARKLKRQVESTIAGLNSAWDTYVVGFPTH
jgi:hypothetical protein